jgi:hypothetical protein
MHRKLISASIVALLVASPAFAATQYYVVHKPGDKLCSVTTTKPDGKIVLMVGTSSFKTALDATTAMKAAAECKK